MNLQVNRFFGFTLARRKISFEQKRRQQELKNGVSAEKMKSEVSNNTSPKHLFEAKFLFLHKFVAYNF